MPEHTRNIRMKKSWIVCGEKWKKGRTYLAAPNEYRILVEELQVAAPAETTREIKGDCHA